MTASGKSSVAGAQSPAAELGRVLQRWLPAPRRVVLAVSGGCDSVALLRSWAEIREKRGDEILAATFNHRLRADSGEDCHFVCELCRSLGVPCASGAAVDDIQSANGSSIEGAARAARYSYLVDVARRWNAPVVVTAHTADDQVETVLMAILRGTGLSGLAGMRPKRPLAEGITLWRPFLQVRRRDLQQWLESLGQPFRVDPSNLDRAFTRNRLRSDLLPMLRERFNPRVDDAILRLSAHAAAAADRERRAASRILLRALLGRSTRTARLDADVLTSAHPGLASAALRLLFLRSGWPRRHMGRKEYLRILAVAGRDGPQACELPQGFRARRVLDDRSILEIRSV